jgi:hypothetical protein
VPGTGAARTSASADALAALREEPGGFFSDEDVFSSSSDGDDDGEVLPALSPQRRGVSPRTLRRIPSVSYGTPACCVSDERKDASDAAARPGARMTRRAFDSECAVCLREFVPGEQLARLPACAHLFHRACVERWLCTSRECPKCRTAVASVGEKEGDAGDASFDDDAKTGEGVIVVACAPERFSSLLL